MWKHTDSEIWKHRQMLCITSQPYSIAKHLITWRRRGEILQICRKRLNSRERRPYWSIVHPLTDSWWGWQRLSTGCQSDWCEEESLESPVRRVPWVHQATLGNRVAADWTIASAILFSLPISSFLTFLFLFFFFFFFSRVTRAEGPLQLVWARR